MHNAELLDYFAAGLLRRLKLPKVGQHFLAVTLRIDLQIDFLDYTMWVN